MEIITLNYTIYSLTDVHTVYVYGWSLPTRTAVDFVRTIINKIESDAKLKGNEMKQQNFKPIIHQWQTKASY